ncbi:MAG: hypothetical protein IJS73_04920 [Paludibacteraceae bacterium]|nr:hypothetical protein [Paludibacteraceae bacterium]
MKNNLFIGILAVVLCLSLMPSCKSKKDSDNPVLGKSFKYHGFYDNGLSEDTKIISFISRSMCNVRMFGHEYSSYDFEKTTWSYDETIGYTLTGNQIVTEAFEPWGDVKLVFRYENGSLIYEESGEVYVYDGKVDIDDTADSMLPPDGKRAYLPVGAWYESGQYESYIASRASGMASAGDSQGLQLLGSMSDESAYYESATGVHIVDENTLETTIAGVSLHSPGAYYATRSYLNYTFYFYYATIDNTYKYMLVDNVVYLKDNTGAWKKSGEYNQSSDKLDLFFPSLSRVDYNGGYMW